jgi:hypothetical protein
MSVYVGIDVHRKRSQVAVVTEGGQVQLNKNVVNGSEPMLRLMGDLPSGTPVAFEAAFGWGCLVQLPEDYGFDPHPGAPAAVQGDRLRAAEERQGPTLPSWRSCSARTAKRSPQFAATYSSIAKRRGKKIATIAIARKLLTRAWHLPGQMQPAEARTPPRQS